MIGRQGCLAYLSCNYVHCSCRIMKGMKIHTCVIMRSSLMLACQGDNAKQHPDLDLHQLHSLVQNEQDHSTAAVLSTTICCMSGMHSSDS